MYLKSKFWKNYKLFDIEMLKINYIRDYCKKIIFDYIKMKTNIINQNHYIIIENIIQNLKNIFEKFDKESKTKAEFQNPKFYINIKDFKKTFDQFHIKFIITITSLNMNKREKMSYLKRIISQRLKNRILNYSQIFSHREFISRLR